jgi:hypothetical protein
MILRATIAMKIVIIDFHLLSSPLLSKHTPQKMKARLEPHEEFFIISSFSHKLFRP